VIDVIRSSLDFVCGLRCGLVLMSVSTCMGSLNDRFCHRVQTQDIGNSLDS
jgi:hypothetical protein